MEKQTIQRWQSLLMVTIVAFILLGASSVAFGQKSLNAKYPKPDFSAMEEYWEIVEYEYDYTGNGLATFNVIAKKKESKVPREWLITWYDGKGVKVEAARIGFDSYNTAKVGEPVRGSAYAPYKVNMPRVKSIVVTEYEN